MGTRPSAERSDRSDGSIRLSHEYEFSGSTKRRRYDVVNAFDKIYHTRDGSGIGMFTAHAGEGTKVAIKR
jgi:hypothetical protein